MKQQFNLAEAQKRLGVEFKQPNLIKQAFTHSSFANEHHTKSNERLEFLGDSVLGFIVTDKIYSCVNLPEGELSKLRSLLVSVDPLSEVIDKLNLDELMLKGVGESKAHATSKAMKCDLFEAIVGAIYLDVGLGAAREFVLSHLGKKMAELKTRDNFEDSKTQLQERFVREKVVYNTKKTGEDHSPVYVSNVLIGGVVCGHGEAGNKRTAEMMAASEALKKVTKV